MTVSDRDVVAAITDLDLWLTSIPEPIERLRLLTLAFDLMNETLGPTTDKAIYEARVALGTIDNVVAVTGWKRWRVKAAVLRHCEYAGIPTPYLDRGPLTYVPIV